MNHIVAIPGHTYKNAPVIARQIKQTSLKKKEEAEKHYCRSILFLSSEPENVAEI